MTEILPLDGESLPTVRRFLSDRGVSAGGLRGLRFTSALCRDALKPRGSVTALVARRDGEVVGTVVAIAGWQRYWAGFLLRHPLLALRPVARRAARRLLARGKPRNAGEAAPGEAVPARAEPTDPGGPGPARAEGPGVAKVLIITVAPAARGQGVGRDLYRALFARLREAGVTTVLAQVSPDNEPSLRLHHTSGWDVSHRGREVYFTRTLT
jgi:ribosomal protein S18 acetylase RimI-like enzyme